MREVVQSQRSGGTRGSFAAFGAIVGVTLLVIACQNEPLGVEPATTGAAMMVPVPTGGCYSNQSVNFGSLVGCGSTTIAVTPSSFKSAVEAGAARWNLAGSPISFSYTDDFAHAQIKITVSGSGPWCGISSLGSIAINTQGCNGNKADLAHFTSLIAHELGHQVGFTSNYHSGDETTAGHCQAHLPDVLTEFSTAACEFEVNFLATMLSSGGPTVNRDKHILTGLAGVDGAITLDVAQALSVGPNALQLARVNGSICPSTTDEFGNVITPTTWDACSTTLPLSGQGIQVVATGGIMASGWNGSGSSVTGITRGPASVRFHLIDAGGSYYLARSLTDFEVPVTVLAPGLSVAGGQPQQGTKGTILPLPLKVQVMDGGVQPIAGRTVTFVPASGSGTVSAPSVVTDVNGYAQVTWTLGTNTSESVVATLTGPTARTVTFTATAFAGPDLQVTGISGATTLPLYATAAAGYTLNFKNFGDVATNSTTWYMSLAMSTDQAYSAGDPRIAASSMSTPMAAYGSTGDAGLRSLFFVPPAGTTPGMYYLVARLDTTNVVVESDETNNAGASAAITLTANGDMVIDNVAGPASIAPGASTTASVTVRNAGSDPARPSQVRVYLSTDNAYQVGDVLIGSLNDTPLMTAGVIRTENVSVTIPVGQPLGNYYLVARVDADSTVYESNEGNNTRASTSQVSVAAPSYPDLIVNSLFQAQTTVTAGQSYRLIMGTARNTGTATAPAGWQGRLYLSANTILDAGDAIVGTVTFGALAPATNQSIALTSTVPNVSDGNYYLLYVVDIGGVVSESNEGNNVGVSAGTMEVIGLP